MKIKSLISIIAAKITLFFSKKLFKGGSNFPGKIALKFDSSILKTITTNYKVIMITGTNGKTTTTSMIYNIIKEAGYDVITNNTGANMLPGITSCFIDNYKFGSSKERYAIIEVDEANLKFITKHLTPWSITITNLFRDQLDRYGEVYTTLSKIMEGVNLVPDTKLILNGDESLLGDLKVPNPITYFGFGLSPTNEKVIDINSDAKFCKFCKTNYEYNFVSYNHLGDFYCPSCGYKRPELKYTLTNVLDITSDNSLVEFNDHEFNVTQSGVYNIYNALCAYAITKELGIDDKIINTSFNKQESSFGRQEVINIDGKEVKIILVKNPAGYNQAIDTLCLSKDSLSVSFFLNDNYADGRDVSWIWDVNFEKLATLDLKDILISGERMYDMAVRLKTAGIPTDKFKISSEFSNITDYIKACSGEKIYILATYTAMINYRKHLHSKGYIKKLW
ncbi:Mur ligase family protein [Clostridium yunnanense]|uniref:Mur ligase family protein n=1 Tax=Clostridium yunnanense TaxID=2800325 RepID=UPI00308443D4